MTDTNGRLGNKPTKVYMNNMMPDSKSDYATDRYAL